MSEVAFCGFLGGIGTVGEFFCVFGMVLELVIANTWQGVIIAEVLY